jgi:hypothetical protein
LEGRYVLYSDDFAEDSWKDYSWNTRLVDFQSYPGLDSSSAIDADIEGWGAFALSKVKPPVKAHSLQQQQEKEEEEEEPDFVFKSDAAASELSMHIQGPLKSSGGEGSNSNQDGSEWLFLTDGRVIPKLQNENTLALRTVEKYVKPTSLNDVTFHLEDSLSGRSTQPVLLWDILSPEASAAMKTALIDDSRWTPLRINLVALLEAAGMSKWDKLVLKDVTGSGFRLRLDHIRLRTAISILTPYDDELRAEEVSLDEGAQVFMETKIDSGSSKVIHRWLPSEDESSNPNAIVSPTTTNQSHSTSSEGTVYQNALDEFLSSAKRCKRYTAPVNIAHVSDGGLKEPSGFAASRRYKGILWTHQDRDTEPYLYAVIAKTGQVVAKLYVDTKKYGETDWEDISVALCPDKSGDHCLWIADSGNVRRDREVFFVHVFREPTLNQHSSKVESWSIWTFPYEFPLDRHGKRPWIDIESLMVKPDGSQFWLVEKTVNGNGRGPVTIWETPEGRGPIELVASDKDNALVDITKRGRDAVYGNKDLLVEMSLVKKITNPNINIVAPYLRVEAFDDPPLPDWAKEKYEEGGVNWNKLRAITGVDIHPSGRSLVACTYSGIWEYDLQVPFDLHSMGQPKLLSVTSRYDDPFWQTESVAYDSDGTGIWLASEYYKGHQPIRYFGCQQ